MDPFLGLCGGKTWISNEFRLARERLNYILWIQDLLDTTGEGYSDRYGEKREVAGLDMYVTLLEIPSD